MIILLIEDTTRLKGERGIGVNENQKTKPNIWWVNLGKKIITHSATISWIWGLSFHLFSEFHREISALDPPSRRPRPSSFNTLSSPINFSSRSFRRIRDTVQE
ncbi:hypothetical protein L1987_31495 [Smallanthus sonchifolius]|uniref:Uncharacterized protein n=1 Tax=Smallanthus sonchifolius TaxID=185202 RepID=A0ACB9I5R1_9ASTR|nr:hypothetical protein L1987_31495 [Smallanthus sonchifolius]